MGVVALLRLDTQKRSNGGRDLLAPGGHIRAQMNGRPLIPGRLLHVVAVPGAGQLGNLWLAAADP